MGERIIEELTEQELMSIVGGAEGRNVTKTGDNCPICGTGTLVQNGNKYVCDQCFKAFRKQFCRNCGKDQYSTEFSGGREKCVVCKNEV